VPYLRHLAGDLRTRIYDSFQRDTTEPSALNSPRLYGTTSAPTSSTPNQESTQTISQQSFPYLGWQTAEHTCDWMPETNDHGNTTITTAQAFSPPVPTSNRIDEGSNRKGSTPSMAMNDSVMPIAMDAQQLLNYSQLSMRENGTGETWPPAFIGWLDQSGINAVHNYFDHM
jgi:hypothetical protein